MRRITKCRRVEAADRQEGEKWTAGRQADRQARQAGGQAGGQKGRRTGRRAGGQAGGQARQAGGQAGGQADRQAERQARQAGGQAGRRTGRKADRQADRKEGRRTGRPGRQADRQADRQARQILLSGRGGGGAGCKNLLYEGSLDVSFSKMYSSLPYINALSSELVLCLLHVCRYVLLCSLCQQSWPQRPIAVESGL
jgi:hypothetical protein